jgi:hypothetical protein
MPTRNKPLEDELDVNVWPLKPQVENKNFQTLVESKIFRWRTIKIKKRGVSELLIYQGKVALQEVWFEFA